MLNCAQHFTCTVEACTKATETHKPGSNAVSYGCPLRLGTVTTCAVLTQKTNYKEKKQKTARVKTKTETESCQQTRVQCPQRGAVGRHLRQRAAQGKAEESKANGQWEVAPGLSAAAGLARLPKALGEPSATVFNECKRGRRGLPLTLSSATEDARNRGSINHGGPGSGRGTCPGERRQEPFVWQGPEMELMLRTEGLCSRGQICWSTGGHKQSHIWRKSQNTHLLHTFDGLTSSQYR